MVLLRCLLIVPLAECARQCCRKGNYLNYANMCQYTSVSPLSCDSYTDTLKNEGGAYNGHHHITSDSIGEYVDVHSFGFIIREPKLVYVVYRVKCKI